MPLLREIASRLSHQTLRDIAIDLSLSEAWLQMVTQTDGFRLLAEGQPS